jgi:hydrogenase expression/formation protein HypC
LARVLSRCSNRPQPRTHKKALGSRIGLLYASVAFITDSLDALRRLAGQGCPSVLVSALGNKFMCLAIPAKITELRDNQMATVEVGGVQQDVCIALLDDVKIGDYVIMHVGYALNKLDPEEAAKTLDLFKELDQIKANATE